MAYWQVAPGPMPLQTPELHSVPVLHFCPGARRHRLTIVEPAIYGAQTSGETQSPLASHSSPSLLSAAHCPERQASMFVQSAFSSQLAPAVPATAQVPLRHTCSQLALL